jgi:hypothetical protein
MIIEHRDSNAFYMSAYILKQTSKIKRFDAKAQRRKVFYVAAPTAQ